MGTQSKCGRFTEHGIVPELNLWQSYNVQHSFEGYRYEVVPSVSGFPLSGAPIQFKIKATETEMISPDMLLNFQFRVSHTSITRCVPDMTVCVLRFCMVMARKSHKWTRSQGQTRTNHIRKRCVRICMLIYRTVLMPVCLDWAYQLLPNDNVEKL